MAEPVVISSRAQPTTTHPMGNGRTQDGTWRPDRPFTTRNGLKITLRRAVGLTPNDVLKVPFRFQVPPVGDFRRPYRFNWATYDTLGAGQKSRPMGAQLMDISIETLLMDVIAARASTGVVVWEGRADPQRFITELRYIAGLDDARKGPAAPFRLVIEQNAVWDHPLVSILATITAVEAVQRNGAVGTEYLSLGFLEYEHDDVDQQARQRKPADTHKLEDGDTLHDLAERYLHRASAWQDIAKANGIKGVDPESSDELAAWAKRHHKKKLRIPEVEMRWRETGSHTTGARLGGGALA